ncbi:rho GTPase-activating protein 11A-like [Heptranchias perlo]|uniref:rho GTPase-activating protein 11A-like n=1 Tax=Heptranchias perlo TaxID=212740 RepID=UPI00355A1243
MKDAENMELSCALVQYLKSLGIKVRNLKYDTEKRSSNGLVFGNPLHVVPQYSLPNGCGTVPRFLVEACSFLNQHLQTEGIFRKSGSAFRMRNLKSISFQRNIETIKSYSCSVTNSYERAKLQQGDCSVEFTSASDVAGLLKQFFRELPEPIVPAEFRGPLCQAQQLQAEGERGAATVLLTCLMPRINAATMNYFLTFLQTVATRSEENKMGVHNLAVVFTPNLFQLFDANDKLAGNVEKVLPLLTVAAETLIIQAQNIGHLPPFILEKLPVLLDAEPRCLVSSADSQDEGRKTVTMKQGKRPRRSVGVIVSGALSKLKTSITQSSTPQIGRVSVALQQTVSPVANTLLTAKRKATDESSQNPGITAKRRRSVTELTEAEPKSPLDGRSPGVANSTSAVCCQAEDPLSEGMESPSVFLKPSMEGAMPSAEGSKALPTSSMKREGNRKAPCSRTQRAPPKREASPWPLAHPKERVRKSLRCFGLNRCKDSKFSLPLNLASKESKATCCDLLTPTITGSLDGSPLAGTNVLLTPVSQRSDPLGNGLFNMNDMEDYASHHLSPHMDFNTLSDAELSKIEGSPLQDSSGLIISPSDPAFETKKPHQILCKFLSPRVADTPTRSLWSEMVEWDQPWRGHNEILKLDLDSHIGEDVSTPCFLQVPLYSSVPNCKMFRRSLSLPEVISESKGKEFAEGDVEAEFTEFPDVHLKTLDASNDASSMAVNENSLNFNREHKKQSVPYVEACCNSIDVEGCSNSMNGNSKIAQGLPIPVVVLTEEDHVENRASNSLYDMEDKFRSAEKCKQGSHDPLRDTREKSSSQPSKMEMARSSVAEYIRKLNKLSAKRRSLKRNFLKVPTSSKQTSHQSSVLKFAQHASTLFGKKPEGHKHQGARQLMRRSISLESALCVCKELEVDSTSKQDINYSCSPETNNPECSGVSNQHLFSSKKGLTLSSPQGKVSRLSPVRRPIFEDRRKLMSPDKPGSGIWPGKPWEGVSQLTMGNDTQTSGKSGLLLQKGICTKVQLPSDNLVVPEEASNSEDQD